jgi:pyridoxamine 5'-phosphate oxidase
MILLKTVDERGFVFYTNYGSRKAGNLESNPQAALCFHWAVLERQVRVEGVVERVTPEESFAYYSTRLRGSRIGAWASLQSQPLASREELEERVRRFAREHPGNEVPIPPYWGGYLLRPRVLEFWQGKANRLHERLVFRRGEGRWETVRLYP